MTDFYVEMSSRTGCFANSYFSHTIKEWNNLSLEIQGLVSMRLTEITEITDLFYY